MLLVGVDRGVTSNKCCGMGESDVPAVLPVIKQKNVYMNTMQ